MFQTPLIFYQNIYQALKCACTKIFCNIHIQKKAIPGEHLETYVHYTSNHNQDMLVNPSQD